ncbi:formate/nitrite transporter family protein [Fulvivirga sp. RKSG066]|uniref:formate/nitrite transporter family protein n=1 Tax=Fulvivirga aurantia TaxID=2529383 RepID=UPI0012BC8649|nr:formate/nitrite transporter family protein [Fulvivirga aurantia]MTI20443.1 formate/nitrite transporter family protein [Fulvivirga aurantia]
MNILKFFKPKPQKVADVSNEPKSASDIFQGQIEAGMAEHKRCSEGLFFSALSAGLEVGFTLLLVGVMYTLFKGQVSESALHVILAFSYPIGFIFVVIGRSELFTEHTTLAVIPVLDANASFKSLLRVWGVIYGGNLLGGYIIGAFISSLGPAMEIISVEAIHEIAHKLVKYQWYIILGSSILAGWLMGLLSWLVTSAQETVSRILIVYIITTLIGMGGLHHSIVGSIEVFADVLQGGTSFLTYTYFQWWATIGNIIGGAIFVSLIKYGTIRFSRKDNS